MLQKKDENGEKADGPPRRKKQKWQKTDVHKGIINRHKDRKDGDTDRNFYQYPRKSQIMKRFVDERFFSFPPKANIRRNS